MSSFVGMLKPIAWKDRKPTEHVSDVGERIRREIPVPNGLTPAGILGWLTGQHHISFNGDTMKISIQFGHDCLARNTHHTICFPTVGACGRVVTLPVAHMRKQAVPRHLPACVLQWWYFRKFLS